MGTSKAINLLENKKVAIIGGGPGGLTLARLLQLKGVNVKVYERDINKDARVQGAIVDLHYDSGLKVIEAAGLLDAFKANYMQGADKYRMLDKNSDILIDEHAETAAAGFGDKHFRPEIDRGALRNILIDSLTNDTVIWDSQFLGMHQIDGEWELEFKNGTKATADIVIGSDGYRSSIRPYVTDIKALYSGATIIQGEVEHPEVQCPEIYALVDHANLNAVGEGKSIVVQPRGDGGFTFYVPGLYPEHWAATSGLDFSNKEAAVKYLLERFEGWHPAYFKLFEASTQFTVRPLDYFPLDQQWDSKSNITLIGDAAHLMPPSGEGVNTAMLDALDLCGCLTGGEYRYLLSAIEGYEKLMLSRAAVLGQESLAGIKEFALPTDASTREFLELLRQNGMAKD